MITVMLQVVLALCVVGGALLATAAYVVSRWVFDAYLRRHYPVEYARLLADGQHDFMTSLFAFDRSRGIAGFREDTSPGADEQLRRLRATARWLTVAPLIAIGTFAVGICLLFAATDGKHS